MSKTTNLVLANSAEVTGFCLTGGFDAHPQVWQEAIPLGLCAPQALQ